MSNKKKDISIVGAGIAGARLAHLMAKKGMRVRLFDPVAPWEKPCGGGLTRKVYRDFPDIRKLDLNARKHRRIEIISPSGQRSSLSLRWSINTVSRKRLGTELLNRATESGAEFLPEKVKAIARRDGKSIIRTDSGEYEADLVVGADGVNSRVRKIFSRRFDREDLCLTYSALLPCEIALPIVFKFFKGFQGYAWIFPRNETTSVGIALERGDIDHDELVYKLEQFIKNEWKRTRFPRPDLRGGRAWFLPAMRRESFADTPLCGDGWALIGDASGAADPLTGEGIYYSLVTAKLLCEAVEADHLPSYGENWQEMAKTSIHKVSKVTDKFYNHRVLNLLCLFLDYSPSVRKLARELIAGRQDYWTLKSRVYSNAHRYIAEAAWNKWVIKEKGERETTNKPPFLSFLR